MSKGRLRVHASWAETTHPMTRMRTFYAQVGSTMLVACPRGASRLDKGGLNHPSGRGLNAEPLLKRCAATGRSAQR
jgi:hypothetical protein